MANVFITASCLPDTAMFAARRGTAIDLDQEMNWRAAERWRDAVRVQAEERN